MKSELPVIHVGWPRAGSTTLQRALFDQHPDLIPFHRLDSRAGDEGVLQMIKYRDSLNYSQEKSIEATRRAMESAGPGRVVVSDEALVMTYFPYRFLADRTEMALRLKAVFGPAKILMITRRRPDILRSLHAHLRLMAKHHVFLERFGPSPPVEPRFETWLRRELDRLYSPILDLIDYQAVIGLYVSIFGPENIIVRRFEDLCRDSHKFGWDLCECLGVDPEQGAPLMRKGHYNRSLSSLELFAIPFAGGRGPRQRLVMGAARKLSKMFTSLEHGMAPLPPSLVDALAKRFPGGMDGL